MALDSSRVKRSRSDDQTVSGIFDDDSSSMDPADAYTDNAILTALRLIASATSGSVGPGTKVPSFSAVSSLLNPTGPSEDEATLFCAGPRPNPLLRGGVVSSPACASGRQCIARRWKFEGAPEGGCVLMAAMTPAELKEHYTVPSKANVTIDADGVTYRTLEPIGSNPCLLCLWHHVLRYSMLARMPSMAILNDIPPPRLARVDNGPDSYSASACLMPGSGQPTGLSGPVVRLRTSLVYFAKYGSAERPLYCVKLDRCRSVPDASQLF